ncbi:hypothetical protein [Haladaptatus sp. CMAA 1911]|uniref:DUF7344 domain-containing protein n=2 Tax=unclassified Haladaptatus TaxID=2622732 RepID=UPI0037547C67
MNVNTDSKTIDEMFDLFSSARRRRLWLYMTDTDDEVFPFEELVDHLTMREENGGEEELRRTSIEATLHHIDLPKLGDFGLIEYDARSGTVRCGDTEMRPFIEDLVRIGP